MFSRVRVVSGLLCVLALFALLQLFSGGMFFKLSVQIKRILPTTSV